MRKFLLVTHKYMGLFLGLLLSVTGISGSLLVFDRELDELLAPKTTDFDSVVTLAPLSVALENARTAVNNGTEPTRIMLGRNTEAPHIIRFPSLNGASGPIEVSIDPGTAEVKAVRIWGEYPVTWIYKLHYTLLAGKVGNIVVGVIGLCLLYFCFSGLAIWLPRPGRHRKKQWRRALSIKRGAGTFRFNYDLHKTIGIYLLPVFIVLAFSGVELVFHEPVEKIVSAFSRVEQRPSPLSTPGRDKLTVDQAATIAQSVFENAKMVRVYLPRNELDAYAISFIQQGELWTEYGASAVWIDQHNGKTLDVWNSKNLTAGNTFLEWQFPLHNGDALGIMGRVLIFVVGFLPALLFGTGTYIWWCKKRPKSIAVKRIFNAA